MPTEQIIIASIQGVISIVILIAVIWKNNILKTQIQKSDTLISQMEAYQKLIDINKLKEFVDVREQTIIGKTEIEKKQFEEKLRAELEDAKKAQKNTFEFMMEPAEVLRDIIPILYKEKSDRKEFIKNRLPKTGYLFETYLEDFEKSEITDTPKIKPVSIRITRNDSK